MADEELVRILKEEGAEAWNRFVEEQRISEPEWRADLRDADLFGIRLSGANLTRSDLRGAKLYGANLFSASLRGSNLDEAGLIGASLTNADLTAASFRNAVLIRVDFQRAGLRFANLTGAVLSSARLYKAICRQANFSGAGLHRTLIEASDLAGARFKRAEFSQTRLVEIDLSAASGLDEVSHRGASRVGMTTLAQSTGQLPPRFLRGCGLTDWEIENAKLYDPDLTAAEITDIQYEVFRLRTTGPIQISPVFLSHSSEDHGLVERLHDVLQGDGIRCWLDKHRLTAGPLEQQIDQAIRAHPTVVLVLSKHSVESDWVMWEAEKARELEKSTDRPALCPIALDKAWKDCKWPGWLRSQIKRYHVVPFDDLGFDEGYLRLRDGLGIYYPQGPPSG